MIFGKLLGGLFGYAWYGFFGGLLGLYIGHLFDKGLAQVFNKPGTATHSQIQEAFFRLTFILMGRLAKVDGQVTQDEIRWAEHVMTQLNLTPELRRQAIDLFQQGKQDEYDLEPELIQFRRIVGRHATLIQMFLEIQIQAGYADGELSHAELELLQRVCGMLGISNLRFEMIHQRIKAERAFSERQYGGGQPHMSVEQKLQEAYQVLGVKASDTDAIIKKAYRRLMSQHHPDKLVAKGLPEEMMRLAKEKTQEIQAAYENIKQARSNP